MLVLDDHRQSTRGRKKYCEKKTQEKGVARNRKENGADARQGKAARIANKEGTFGTVSKALKRRPKKRDWNVRKK